MAAARKFVPSSETTTDGNITTGTINGTPQGFETFTAAGAYVATFPTKERARRALFELHRDSQAAVLTAK